MSRFCAKTYPDGGLHTNEALHAELHRRPRYASQRLKYMLYVMVDGFGDSAMWKGYSFINDMKEYALAFIIKRFDQYDPEKTSDYQNPYRYFVQMVNMAFLLYIKKKKENPEWCYNP